MRRVLAQFLPLIVILVVLASIMRVFATTEKSAGDKLSFWDRFLITLGLREKPVAEEAREFEYIPGRLQQPTAPSYQIRPLDETTTYQTPTSPPASPSLGGPAGGLKNIPPPPPLPPSRPQALGVKTAQPPRPPIPPLPPQALGVKTTSSITSFFSGIFRSLLDDLGLAKPKPPIPPVSPASPSLGGPKTLGVQDQKPLPPPVPPLPPIPPRVP